MWREAIKYAAEKSTQNMRKEKKIGKKASKYDLGEMSVRELKDRFQIRLSSNHQNQI